MRLSVIDAIEAVMVPELLGEFNPDWSINIFKNKALGVSFNIDHRIAAGHTRRFFYDRGLPYKEKVESFGFHVELYSGGHACSVSSYDGSVRYSFSCEDYSCIGVFLEKDLLAALDPPVQELPARQAEVLAEPPRRGRPSPESIAERVNRQMSNYLTSVNPIPSSYIYAAGSTYLWEDENSLAGRAAEALEPPPTPDFPDFVGSVSIAPVRYEADEDED